MNEVIALMRERLNYDAETGVLMYSKQAKGNKREGDKVGCIDRQGYIKVMFQRKMYFAHRIAWMVHYGSEPPELIDHINRDKQATELQISARAQSLRTQQTRRQVVQKMVYEEQSA